jgi:LysM repeat protein
VFALLLGARIARADVDDGGVRIHKVKAGDSFELLAAEYYEDRNDAVFLLVANHLKHPRKLVPGEKIRVPVSRTIVTSKGDTWELLGQQYLGNPRRGTYLADFNNRSPDEPLPAGTQLVVPFTVMHTAEAAETLASISLAYFGTDKEAELLRGYNFLDKDHETLQKGDSIIVPIHHVKMKASKVAALDADALSRRAERERQVDKATTALPNARAAWRAGDYAGVRDELRGIDLSYLEVGMLVEVGMLRGAADVAFGLTSDAQGEFEAVLAHKRDAVMHGYEFSPTIRAIWKKAGGAVDD